MFHIYSISLIAHNLQFHCLKILSQRDVSQLHIHHVIWLPSAIILAAVKFLPQS